jgi:DNA-binding PadR family transcriptional regulator
VLTELEGAILSEIHHRGDQTAFQVRRSFALSPSLEWKGSAGAVYPAIKRLEKSGLIAATALQDKRATRILSLTDAGRAAMMEWACAPARAVSTGIDPFRMRAGIWVELPAAERRKVLERVKAEIESNIAFLRGFSRNKDTIERISVDLALRLQQARLGWIEDMLGG